METPLVNGDKLKPMSYHWTRKLALDDEDRDPTRFELFNARKECENLIRISNLNRQHELEMLEAIHGCMMRIFKEVYRDNSTIEEIQNLLNSKRATRSMTAKFENAEEERNAILSEILHKLWSLEELRNMKRIGSFLKELLKDVDAIVDRVTANRDVCDELSDRLKTELH